MIVDYSNDFPEAIAAQGKDRNFLALYKLNEPFQRFDKKIARYYIEYRWLSANVTHERDEAWACCQGSEISYWQTKELPIKDIINGEVSLFEILNLF